MGTHGTFIIRPEGLYDFDLSYSFYRRSKFELIDHFGENCFVRPFLFGGTPIVIKVSSPRPRSDRLTIHWQSPEGVDDRDSLRCLLARMFYLDFDIRKFYRLRLDPAMKKLTRTYAGFRPILTPDVFEAAAWAIIGQQVTLYFAYLLKERLVEKVNRTFRQDRITFHLFPSAEDIARLDHDTLRSMQLSTRKAEYLLNFSRLVAERKLDLESLKTLDYEAAAATLLAIRGIGPWSANYILMRGVGHQDAFPIGDSGINRAVKNLYGWRGNPDMKRLLALGDKWRPYRSLAGFYLWKSL